MRAALSHSPRLRGARSGIAASRLTLQNPQAHEFHREAIALLAAMADDIMLLQGVQGRAQSGCRQVGAAGEGLAIGGPGGEGPQDCLLTRRCIVGLGPN